ncbi:Tyrosine recombinase XerC [Lachnospiraceae bacterium TWA4]|nr:Tyrosine recombinase XerC [Lachnospiraceae bacterium TWA4]
MAISKQRSYHEQIDIKNTTKLRNLIEDMPEFIHDFFRGIEQTRSSRTRIAYAYDLRIFFDYLFKNHKDFKDSSYETLTLSMIELLSPKDLERYMEYLKYYEKDEDEHLNQIEGIMRKISTIRTFYSYFYRRELIKYNPAALIEMPKKHDKVIVYMEADEVANLLDLIDSGENLTKRQKDYHAHTRKRDLAMIMLMLGTGIRVSECVGIDITDVDLKSCGIKIHRKGGKEVVIYFGDEVEEVLRNYMEEREHIFAKEGHENALFLSMQRKRISVRSVELLVKKYTQLSVQLKKITPHKLRSTYGTNLYQETGDIYLVADVLGHEDVNTTKKHYAAINDNKRRKARNVVRLRKE